jgi:hypothetical protein
MDETVMGEEIRRLAGETKGFLTEAEGQCLFALAREASRQGPCLEIGSYCGKSALYLAAGCRETGRHPLFCVDHHRGSVEQQRGELFFDADLIDPALDVVDTLPFFRHSLYRAGLEQWVIPIVAESRQMGRYWSSQPLSLLFIDGGHSEEDAFGDFFTWSGHVLPGGYLAIHDVYPNPADGGPAPFLVMQHALEGPRWQLVEQVDSLAILRRITDEKKPGKSWRRRLYALLGKLSPLPKR